MALGSWVNELGRDPDAIVHFSDTAFQYILDAQLPADLVHLYILALVGKYGISGNDKEAGYLWKISDQILSQPVWKILLFFVAAHIYERQHCNGGLVRDSQIQNFLLNYLPVLPGGHAGFHLKERTADED